MAVADDPGQSNHSSLNRGTPKRWRIVITWKPRKPGTVDLQEVAVPLISWLRRMDQRERSFTIRFERED